MADKHDDFEIETPLDNEESDIFDIGIDDFDFDAEDRAPVSEVSKGVHTALKKATTSTGSGIAKKLSSALPQTAEVINEGLDVASDISRLKDDVVEGIQPGLNQLKQAGRRIAPKIEKALPPSINEKIQNVLGPAPDKTRKPSKDEVRDLQINELLNATFGIGQTSNELAEAHQSERRVDNYIDRKLSESRHKDQLGALNALTNLSGQSVAFMHKFTRAYYLKDLELKYKMLFVAQDTLGSVQTLVGVTEKHLDAIRHNTSLPDFAKEYNNEAIRDVIRDTVIGNSLQRSGEYFRNYKDRVFEGIKTKLVKPGIEGFNTISDMLSDVVNMKMDEEEDEFMRRSSGEKAGGLAGGIIGALAGSRLGGSILQMTQDYEGDLEGMMGNLRRRAFSRMNSFARDKGLEFMSPYSRPGGIINPIADSPTAKAIYDVAARTSIVEIIPGYLSKILQQVTNVAMGTTDAEEIVYDPFSRDFKSASTLSSKLNIKAFGTEKTRRERSTNLLGVLKGGNASKRDVDTYKDGLLQVFANLAYNALDLEPKKIKAFANGDLELSDKYISVAFDGVDDPLAVAKILVQSLTDSEGKTTRVFDRAVDALFKATDSDEYLDRAPVFTNALGLSRYMGGLVDDGQKFNTQMIKESFFTRDLLDEDIKKSDERGSEIVNELLNAKRLRKGSVLRTPMELVTGRNLKGVEKELDSDIGEYIPNIYKDIRGEDWRNIGVDTRSLEWDGSGYAAAVEADRKRKRGSSYTLHVPEEDRKPRKKSYTLHSPEKATPREKSYKLHLPEDEPSPSVTAPSTSDDLSRIENLLSSILDKLPTPSTATGSSSASMPVVAAITHFEDTFVKYMRGVREEREEDRKIFSRIADASEKSHQFFSDYFAKFSEWTASVQFGSMGGVTAEELRDLINESSMTKKASKLGKFLKDRISGTASTIKGATSKVFGAATGLAGRGLEIAPSIMSSIASMFGPLLGGVGTAIGAVGKAYGKGLSWVGSKIGGGVDWLFSSKSRKSSFCDIYRQDQLEPGYPLVSKQQLIDGLFFADGSPVKSSYEIDGPVLDKDGNTLITQEDINAILVDVYGNVLYDASDPKSSSRKDGKGVLGKAWGGVKGVANFLFKDNPLFKLYGGVLTTARDVLYGTGNFLKETLFGSKTKSKDLKELVGDKLDLIYQLLLKRLPNRSSVEGDFDGDGFRDNSWRDQLADDEGASTDTPRNRAYAAAQRLKGKIPSGMMPGLSGLGLGGLGALFGKQASDSSDDDGSGLVDTAVGTVIGDQVSKKGIKGTIGSILSKGKGLLKGGGKLLLRGGGALLTGGAALLGGLGSAGSLLASGVGTVGSAIGSGIGAIGAAGGALASAAALPWVLGAAAVGAIGYGAYRLLSGSKTSKTEQDLGKARCKLYGVSDKYLEQVLELEKDTYEILNNESDPFDESDIEDWTDEFGFDDSNKDEVSYWLTWYQKRFVKTFKVFLLTLRDFDIRFANLDEITPEQSKQIIPHLNKLYQRMSSDIATTWELNQSACDRYFGVKTTKKEKGEKIDKTAQTDVVNRKMRGDFSVKSYIHKSVKSDIAGNTPVDVVPPTPIKSISAAAAMGTLGALSAKYESSAKGAAAIGYDRNGGTSYGTYQLSSRQGTMRNFITWAASQGSIGAEVAKRLRDAGGSLNTLGTEGSVPDVWRKLAKEGKLDDLEHKFIEATHYQPALRLLKTLELQSLVEQTPALRQVLWSTAVQHGASGAARIFNKAWKPGISKREFVAKIYKIRGTKFKSSTPNVRASVQSRFQEEQKIALGMLEPKAPDEAKRSQIASLSTPKTKPSLTGVNVSTPEIKDSTTPQINTDVKKINTASTPSGPVTTLSDPELKEEVRRMAAATEKLYDAFGGGVVFQEMNSHLSKRNDEVLVIASTGDKEAEHARVKKEQAKTLVAKNKFKAEKMGISMHKSKRVELPTGRL